jgi:hypothetical protein
MSKKSSDIGGIITQKLLGQNEDTIAAIVENLQLGRLDDCMQQYKVLHHNLVSLAHELDNIPTEDSDAYQFIDGFPDEIMRLDPLDDLLPLEEKNLPKLPLIPPCPRCHQLQVMWNASCVHEDLQIYFSTCLSIFNSTCCWHRT